MIPSFFSSGELAAAVLRGWFSRRVKLLPIDAACLSVQFNRDGNSLLQQALKEGGMIWVFFDSTLVVMGSRI